MVYDPDHVFDVIKDQLLVTVFKGGNPDPFLRTVTKMLKPGDWLRWSDCKSLTSSFNAVTLDATIRKVASERVMAMVKRFYVPLEVTPDRFDGCEQRFVSDTVW